MAALTIDRETLWSQFGASIDMLGNAIDACPEALWATDDMFWYRAYHTLFFLDYYLDTDPRHFAPPAPYTLSEFDPSGKLPDRAYDKQELQGYLEHCRLKCRELILGSQANSLEGGWNDGHKDLPFSELLLYNMRHVQHHTGQLNMILSQGAAIPPKWIGRKT